MNVALLASALEVLRLVVSAEAEQDKMRERYAYREVQENLPRIKVFDVIFLEGAPYRRLIEKNGKLLTGKEQKAVVEDMKKTVAERRASRNRGRVFTRYFTMRIDKLENLETTHELSIEGDHLTALPKAGNAYRHEMWIDPETHVILRHEIEVVGPGSELKPGTIVRRQFSREGDSAYLLRRNEVDYKVTFASGKQVHIYTNYKKFDVESTITFEEKP